MTRNHSGLTRTFGKKDSASIVDLLKDQLRSQKIMTFTGPLGAGKTTLVKALLKACGVNETITSPTFTYVNKYTNAAGEVFYHFDLYRIKHVNDFLAMGFDEYLHTPGAYVLIEWPEVIESLLQGNVCHVSLDYTQDDQTRSIQIR